MFYGTSITEIPSYLDLEITKDFNFQTVKNAIYFS